ncbi:MAG: type II secretion system minor pseudopilin GspJ [Halieaceae bacterium]
MKPSPGFTLIEVLIAMAITALVATLSFASLSSTLDSVEGLRSQGERISELNRAWVLLTRDINQFVARPVRNEYGSVESSMFGGAAADQSLSFTRGGWHNTDQRTRSNLQRVRYLLEDTTLWRESYRVLDRSSDSEPQRVALFEGVISFEMAFLNSGTELREGDFDTENWQIAWGSAEGNGQAGGPEALELRLELEDWGEVRWLYEIPHI